jgi:hypothetical protein
MAVTLKLINALTKWFSMSRDFERLRCEILLRQVTALPKVLSS